MWVLAHGVKDVLVSSRLFQKSTAELGRFMDMERDVEGHLYDGMVHSTSAPELEGSAAFGFDRVNGMTS